PGRGMTLIAAPRRRQSATVSPREIDRRAPRPIVSIRPAPERDPVIGKVLHSSAPDQLTHPPMRARMLQDRLFRVAAVRAPQPAAGLHTCVVPSRWFVHHLDRTRNGHVLALVAAKRTLHARGARLLQRAPSGASCPNALLFDSYQCCWGCF